VTWKKTLTYWTLFAVLAAYYGLFEHQAPPPRIQQTKEEQVLPFFEDEVVAVTIQAEGQTIRGELGEKKRWKAVSPPGAQVPSDLFNALVDGLTAGQRAEVVSPSPNDEQLASFGLASPAWMLDVETKGGKKMHVEFGDRNPPSTGVYARTGDAPRVFLVGLNVQYYGELIVTAGSATASASPTAAPAS
jgi:hypothetical protein